VGVDGEKSILDDVYYIANYFYVLIIFFTANPGGELFEGRKGEGASALLTSKK